MAGNKAILVIGAGDATGGAIAMRFAKEGYIACVTRRTVDKRRDGAAARDGNVLRPGRANRRFQLRFRSLFTDGEAFVFPCNASGHVVINALGERARSSYLFARATVGRFYAHSKSLRGAVRIGANLMSSRHLMRWLHRPPATTGYFAAQYPGRAYPSQRFAHSITNVHA